MITPDWSNAAWIAIQPPSKSSEPATASKLSSICKIPNLRCLIGPI